MKNLNPLLAQGFELALVQGGSVRLGVPSPENKLSGTGAEIAEQVATLEKENVWIRFYNDVFPFGYGTILLQFDKGQLVKVGGNPTALQIYDCTSVFRKAMG